MSSQGTLVIPLSRPDFKSYLLSALLSWTEDQGYTPYMLIAVDDATVVPREFVTKDGTITLCVHSEATHNFRMESDWLTFEARFGEQVRELQIPLGRIAAIFPKEDTSLVSYFPVLETKADGPAPARASSKDTAEELPTFTKL